MVSLVTMGMFGGSGTGTPEIVEVQTPMYGMGGGGFGEATMPKIFVNFVEDEEDINIEVKMILISEEKQ